jgi:hypothetical protein
MRIGRLSLVLLWPLAGCGNMSTQTLDLSTVTPKNNVVPGLPFTLNKPQFTITHTAATAGAPESYQAVPSYVADPSQYYAVTLHPALTATIDWTFGWDENGSLSTTNAKVTDQSAATLASLVKLGISIAALDKSQDTQPQVVSEIDARLQTDFDTTQEIFDEAHNALRGADPEELTDLRARWARMKPQLTALAANGDLPTYIYGSEGDRIVLLTALHVQPPPFTKVQNTIDDAKAESDELAAGAAQAGAEEPIAKDDIDAAAKAVVDAYGKFDLSKLQSIEAAAIKARSQRQAVMTLQNAPAAAYTTDVTIRLQTLIASLAQEATQSLKTSPNDVLFALVDVDSSGWEAAVVAKLNKRINARVAIDRANAYATPGGGNIEANDPDLADLNRRKAAVLGLASVYDQVIALQRVPTTSPAAFKAAQDALAPLLKQLADAEAALSTPKPAPAPEPPFVADVLQAPVDVGVNPGWVSDHVKGRPVYVVVMQPIVGAAVGAAPVPGTPSSTTPAQASPANQDKDAPPNAAPVH